jgi:hypothetical protein
VGLNFGHVIFICQTNLHTTLSSFQLCLKKGNPVIKELPQPSCHSLALNLNLNRNHIENYVQIYLQKNGQSLADFICLDNCQEQMKWK